MAVLLIYKFLLPARVEDAEYQVEMIQAASIMHQAIEEVGAGRLQRGIGIDPLYDPNLTGLIGSEFTKITTTLGDLEAKRTTTNPNFAALLVHLLKEAGVNNGDTIAVGASGSFPALLLATLSAARAMDLNPIVICSLSSSMWGANDPDFTLLDIYEYARSVVKYDISALSIGGYRDIGKSMEAEAAGLLERRIRASGIEFIYESDFRKNVETRMSIYNAKADLAEITAFINIGGNEINIGTSASILKVRPGIAEITEFPPLGQQGIIYEFAKKNIPVIHLLNIKKIILDYNLPWDPIPLPKTGSGDIYFSPENGDTRIPLLLLFVSYCCLLSTIFVVFRRWNKGRRV
jgi:poly-gamma-glutamate system protein